MRRNSKIFFLGTLCILTSAGFTNCAKVGFDKESGDSVITYRETPPVDDGTSTPPTSTAVMPKASFSAPKCIKGTQCLVQFKLDKAYSMNVDFDWLTDDDAYTTPSTPKIGQPNVHYVPTNGHVTFTAGETTKSVYVQNINTQNIDIVIPVTMTKCQYGGGPITGCRDYFQ